MAALRISARTRPTPASPVFSRTPMPPMHWDTDDGVQVSWIAPLPVFVEIGGGIGRGANPPGTNRDKNGVGAGTLFAHVGDDIGSGSSYRQRRPGVRRKRHSGRRANDGRLHREA